MICRHVNRPVFGRPPVDPRDLSVRSDSAWTS